MRSRSSIRHSNVMQSGYILLGLMLAVTLMLVAMSIAAPRIAQQIKREKEEELVHRGKDYATAVKRFVHKSGGQFPASLEQLENTNHIRFLRKRYKDPMTGESDWKLVHYGEAQIKIPTTTNNPGLNPSTTNPGLTGGTSAPAGNTSSFSGGGTGFGSSGSSFGSSGSSFGSSGSSFSGGAGLSGGSSGLSTNTGGAFGNNQDGSGMSGGTPLATGGMNGVAGGSQSLGGAPQPGANGQLGSLAVSGLSGGQSGGPIIGVASVSKKESIKEFNDKDHYNDWLFVYDMRLEQSGGTGVTVAEPIAPGSAGTSSGATTPPAPNGQPGSTGTPGQTGMPVATPSPN